ncbi:MAG: sulfatase-like hydrolase/transferase, partial [Thermoanaerobaculia bacterium]
MSDSRFHRGLGGLLALLAVGPQLSCSPERGRPLGSIVVITIDTLRADHGEGLGQQRWMAHGEIHNEQLFVPLLIRFPRLQGLHGQRRSGLVSLLDVVPTLVDTLGLQIPR